MQVSLRASSPRGAGVRKGKREDLIGEILTAQHQRGHRGFFWDAGQVPLLLFLPPPPHPKESLLAGYMQVQECPKNADVRACDTFTGGIDECFVRRSKNALKGKHRHRTLDAFLPAKVKESKGFFEQNWRGGALRLSMLFYYKTYEKYIDLQFCFYFFAWARAYMSTRHACVTGEE